MFLRVRRFCGWRSAARYRASRVRRAVPGIYLCTPLFLSARLRNPEGLSLLALVFWAALCFLVTVLPFDRLLQLCSTAAYAALAVIGLILYGILVHNVQRRREHYDMAYIG